MQEELFNSNFDFLHQEFSLLARLCQEAELYVHSDPGAALFKLRQFGEQLTVFLMDIHQLRRPYQDDFHNRLLSLRDDQVLPRRILDLLFTIKSKGNKAVHQVKASEGEATGALLACFTISKWFTSTYGEGDYPELMELRFSPPPKVDLVERLKEFQEGKRKAEEEAAELKQKYERLSKPQVDELKAKAYRIADQLELTEKETRAIIDEQLREVGWEADTENLRHAKGARPQKGRNIAIAEWPVGSKSADYALFVGKRLYGIVEAKRRGKQTISDLEQAKIYASLASGRDGAALLGEWRGYKAPFLFSSNSRPYHPQLEAISGTWFLDVRQPDNYPRPLRGWLSPLNLKERFKKDTEQANENLKAEPYDYLTDKEGLSLRYYQIEAIQAVEGKVIHENDNGRRALIAMATGTGKTRTIVGLCYRLIKNKRFKRILFLVDRRILGQQAADSFNDVKVDGLHTFGEIYDIKEIGDKLPELDTKIHFATVQSMVKRILYPSEDSPPPAVGTYDCIIVDEAHRGYVLDREMDEEEIEFKDQLDFIGKYKMVLDYFDAFRVGLTATPALHTSQIFGKPVYRYPYQQAVIDGFLIDHEPPINIKTRLSEEGIVWEKGSKPKVLDRESNKILELDELEDEMRIEVEGFNKLVITENFNRVVIQELVKYLDPVYSEEKTLIFAATDEHADMVVRMLKEEFKNAGVAVDDDAIMKITGSVYNPSLQVRKYRNERFPNIVVTVDLLTTGVDVHEICNLVFLRRVRSRILYEQMLGRATRRCDRIGKEIFKIFDAVRLYEALQEVSEMRPVAANPKTTFEQLANEMGAVDKEEAIEKKINELVAKLHRKKVILGKREKQLEEFKQLSEGKTPDEYIEALRAQSPKEAARQIQSQARLLQFLDRVKPSPRKQLISEHEDVVMDVSVGYGKGQKPEDYLDSFKHFLQDNRNKIAAIDIICSRPKELTRQSLKELQQILAEQGYTYSQIRKAWKDAKNEDIAADIIAYIRSSALGRSLETPEERVKRAMSKLKASRPWTQVQLNWLKRIEDKLLEEIFLDEEFFEKEPFKSDGGYRQLNKIFRNELDLVIQSINDNLYSESA